MKFSQLLQALVVVMLFVLAILGRLDPLTFVGLVAVFLVPSPIGGGGTSDDRPGLP